MARRKSLSLMSRIAYFASASEHTTLFETLHDRAAQLAGAHIAYENVFSRFLSPSGVLRPALRCFRNPHNAVRDAAQLLGAAGGCAAPKASGAENEQQRQLGRHASSSAVSQASTCP